MQHAPLRFFVWQPHNWANWFILLVMRKKEPKPKLKLSTKDIFLLILRAYRDTLPYVLMFVLLLVVGTWVLTEVVFR